MASLGNTKVYGDLTVEGITSSNQLFIFGSLTNPTTQNGLATSFTVEDYNGLSFTTDRIIIPQNGFYLITFQSINDSTSSRYDIAILVNGLAVCNALNNIGSGFHHKALSIVLQLNTGDYIQFSNEQWYNYTNVSFDAWRTASVTRLG